MQNPDLQPLLLIELNEMHWFENTWLTTLGELGRATYLPELGKVLKKQRAYKQGHINRLRQIFISFGWQPESRESRALAGLIQELKSACSLSWESDSSYDVSFILAVIKATHYQIGAYRGILWLAHALQNDEAEGRLVDTLSELEQIILDMTELLASHGR